MVLLWVFMIKILSGGGFDITKGAKVTEFIFIYFILFFLFEGGK